MCVPAASINFIRGETVSNSLLICHRIPKSAVQTDSLSTWDIRQFLEIKNQWGRKQSSDGHLSSRWFWALHLPRSEHGVKLIYSENIQLVLNSILPSLGFIWSHFLVRIWLLTWSIIHLKPSFTLPSVGIHFHLFSSQTSLLCYNMHYVLCNIHHMGKGMLFGNACLSTLSRSAVKTTKSCF